MSLNNEYLYWVFFFCKIISQSIVLLIELCKIMLNFTSVLCSWKTVVVKKDCLYLFMLPLIYTYIHYRIISSLSFTWKCSHQESNGILIMNSNGYFSITILFDLSAVCEHANIWKHSLKPFTYALPDFILLFWWFLFNILRMPISFFLLNTNIMFFSLSHYFYYIPGSKESSNKF